MVRMFSNAIRTMIGDQIVVGQSICFARRLIDFHADAPIMPVTRTFVETAINIREYYAVSCARSLHRIVCNGIAALRTYRARPQQNRAQ